MPRERKRIVVASLRIYRDAVNRLINFRRTSIAESNCAVNCVMFTILAEPWYGLNSYFAVTPIAVTVKSAFTMRYELSDGYWTI